MSPLERSISMSRKIDMPLARFAIGEAYRFLAAVFGTMVTLNALLIWRAVSLRHRILPAL